MSTAQLTIDQMQILRRRPEVIEEAARMRRLLDQCEGLRREIAAAEAALKAADCDRGKKHDAEWDRLVFLQRAAARTQSDTDRAAADRAGFELQQATNRRTLERNRETDKLNRLENALHIAVEVAPGRLRDLAAQDRELFEWADGHPRLTQEFMPG